jgi:hypothetical protein
LDDLEEILGIVQLYDMDMCMQSNVSSNGEMLPILHEHRSKRV